jgi:hypothetical protein
VCYLLLSSAKSKHEPVAFMPQGSFGNCEQYISAGESLNRYSNISRWIDHTGLKDENSVQEAAQDRCEVLGDIDVRGDISRSSGLKLN